MESFITKIKVNESRVVRDLEIPLSETNRQHLIITGKNGSGKTSLLETIKSFFLDIEQNEFFEIGELKGDPWSNGNIEISFSKNANELIEKYGKEEFILSYFGAKRTTEEKIHIPTGIKKVDLYSKYGLEDKANVDFLQYLVNLKADRSFARDDKEVDTVEKLDQWFERFENQLKTIFDNKNLKLVFDRKSYNFSIQLDDNKPFGFNTLSDGYSAIISIVTELLLRMEAHNVKAYDMEGLVLIDEIETHLHVKLQKEVLPFLIGFFPKIQFIVTTHSPFVLSSVQNATICDLETRIITTDLSAYSYDALVESFFMTDKYSETVKEKIAEYEKLLSKQEKTIEDTENIKSLQDYFACAKFISKELRIKLNQVELQYL